MLIRPICVKSLETSEGSGQNCAPFSTVLFVLVSPGLPSTKFKGTLRILRLDGAINFRERQKVCRWLNCDEVAHSEAVRCRAEEIQSPDEFEFAALEILLSAVNDGDENNTLIWLTRKVDA